MNIFEKQKKLIKKTKKKTSQVKINQDKIEKLVGGVLPLISIETIN